MDPLDRLYHVLVRAAQQAGALDRPIAIRAVVEELVPYRVARPMRLAEWLDDYRHLLLRLIAGEREFVVADPEVRAACRAALSSRHPDLSLLETFGARQVTLAAPAPVDDAPVAATPTPLRPVGPVGPVGPAGGLRRAVPPPLPSAPVRPAPPRPDEGSDASSPCRYCTRALPANHGTRFCPWCGQHLLRRCRECRAPLETAWTFCVTCGHPA